MIISKLQDNDEYTDSWYVCINCHLRTNTEDMYIISSIGDVNRRYKICNECVRNYANKLINFLPNEVVDIKEIKDRAINIKGDV